MITETGERAAATRNPRALLAGISMTPSCGGMAKTIEAFRRALDASVVSFTDGAQLDREGTAVKGAEHVRTARGLLGRQYHWAPERELARADALARKADFISCHVLYRYHVNWTRRWAQRRGLPYWVVPHGCLDPYVFTYRSLLKRTWVALLGRMHLREARLVIFATRNERKKASGFLSRDNAAIVHWPVAVPEIGIAHPAALDLRASLGVGPGERLLLAVGRLHPMKRMRETVQAFLAAGRPNLHLAIAGPEEGTTYAELRALAGEHPHVHLLGPVWAARRDALYAAADGFVSLSIRENFGHAVAEALAVGIPVILSPGNDLAGEFTERSVGWMLPDDSPATAARAMAEFAEAPREALASLGACGRAWVAEELSFERFQRRLAAFAQETAGASRGETPVLANAT